LLARIENAAGARVRSGVFAAVVVVLLTTTAAPVALADGIPGSGFPERPGPIPTKDRVHYSSVVRGISPAVRGVTVRVILRDDQLEMVVAKPHTVAVRAPDGERFLRVLADGFVQANYRSPWTHRVQERFGRVTIPAQATGRGRPEWFLVSQRGIVRWHDHRIHWMRGERPGQVKDTGVRTKVFDWRIPIVVDGRNATIAGSLFWVPADEGGGIPTGAIVAMVLVSLLVLACFGVVVRRNRIPAAVGSPD
jgi:hypothetical protein